MSILWHAKWLGAPRVSLMTAFCPATMIRAIAASVAQANIDRTVNCGVPKQLIDFLAIVALQQQNGQETRLVVIWSGLGRVVFAGLRLGREHLDRFFTAFDYVLVDHHFTHAVERWQVEHRVEQDRLKN